MYITHLRILRTILQPARVYTGLERRLCSKPYIRPEYSVARVTAAEHLVHVA